MDQVEAPAQSAGQKKSPILAIVLVVIVVLIAAGVYFVFFAKSAAKSILSSVAPISAECKYNDKDLCKFINGWKEVKYYTVNSTSTFEGKEQKTVLKSVGTDKSQIIGSEAGTENMNIIRIGNDTYTKDYTDNKWTKMTSNPDKSTFDSVNNGLEFDQKEESAVDKTEYKKIGTEACGKFTCFKYQVIDSAVTDSTEYILFDNKEYQLRKTISIGKDNNQSIAEFDYSKISIDVPSPVKEAAAITVPSNSTQGSTSSGSASSSVSEQDLNQAIKDAQGASQDLSTTDTSSSDATE